MDSTFKTVECVFDLVGNTPLIRLGSLSSRVNFWGKLEYFNPSGSIKDRTAKGLLFSALEKGDLKPGMTVVESSSGNLGHALAMMCTKLGLKFICIMDKKTPQANIHVVKAFGGEVILLDKPNVNGSFQKARIQLAREMAAQNPNIFNLDQYSNQDALKPHFEDTAMELIKQTDGQLDGLIACVSTGSSLCGTASRLKAFNNDIVVIGVEPEGSVVFGGEVKTFLQNGSGLSFTPENYNREHVDFELKVTDKDAFSMVREFARTEGLLLGGSSGSVIYAAKLLQKEFKDGANVALLLPDSGIKYSETIYNNEWFTKQFFTEQFSSVSAHQLEPVQ